MSFHAYQRISIFLVLCGILFAVAAFFVFGASVAFAQSPDLISLNLTIPGGITEDQNINFQGDVRNAGDVGMGPSNSSVYMRAGAYYDPETVGNTAYNAVSLSGSYAYVAARDIADELIVVDVSNPSAPSRATGLNLPNIDAAYAITLSGNYAYITGISGSGAGKLTIIDVSNPLTPSFVSDAPTADLGFDVDSSEDFVYVASSKGGDDVEIFDVSSKTSPVKIGGLDFTNTQNMRGIVVAGTHAYIVSDHDNVDDGVNPPDFRVINVSNPASPIITSTLEFYPSLGYSANFGPNAIVLTGNYAYVGSDDAVIAVDISNPANPQEVWRGVSSRVNGIGVNGNLLYAVTEFNGVLVYDVTNPTGPVYLGNWGSSGLYGDPNANRGLDITLSNSHVFVARSTTVAGTASHLDVFEPVFTARFCVNTDPSADTCYTSGTGKIANPSVGPIASLASQTVSTPWTAGTPGTYYLHLCADVPGLVGVVAESLESNNCASLQFTVASASTCLPSEDIGLRLFDGAATLKIAAEPAPALTSPFRIRKNTTTYGIRLTADSADPLATKIKIQTAAGTRFFCKI